MEQVKKHFVELMIQKVTHRIDIKNGDDEPYDNKIHSFITEDEFTDLYNGLCSNLTKMTIYKFDIDKD